MKHAETEADGRKSDPAHGQCRGGGGNLRRDLSPPKSAALVPAVLGYVLAWWRLADCHWRRVFCQDFASAGLCVRAAASKPLLAACSVPSGIEKAAEPIGSFVVGAAEGPAAIQRKFLCHPGLSVHLLLSIALVGLTVALYYPVIGYGFVSYDDDLFVTDNSMVKAGLTFPGLLWAFTNTTNFYPLTWLSLMADATLFGGANPVGYHATNLVLHLANTLLVFYFCLRYLSSTSWSFLLAAIFATHPLNVETVAWISERKGLLAGFFWMLSIISYGAYSRHSKPWRYVLVIVFFVGGMLSKPSLLMLPLVLFAFDLYWFRRAEPLERLLAEKLPILLLCLFFLAGTFICEKQAGALAAVGPHSASYVAQKVSNSYWHLAASVFWPQHLTFFYPLPEKWALTSTLLGGVLLAGVVMSTLLWRSPARAVVLWWALSLAPVCGLVQIGGHFTADRYAYIPLVGALLAAFFLLRGFKVQSFASTVTLVLVSAWACFLYQKARLQLPAWKDSLSLYSQAIRVNPDNQVALNNLAWEFVTNPRYLHDQGAANQAVKYALEACRLTKYEHVGMMHTLLVSYLQAGRRTEAIALCRSVLQRYPAESRKDPTVSLFRQVLERFEQPR